LFSQGDDPTPGRGNRKVIQLRKKTNEQKGNTTSLFKKRVGGILEGLGARGAGGRGYLKEDIRKYSQDFRQRTGDKKR